MPSHKSPWTKCIDSKGNPYYYNSETGVSEREKPKEYKGRESEPSHSKSSHWIKQVDDQGNSSYYNKKTGETVHKRPKGYYTSESHRRPSSHQSPRTPRSADKNSENDRERSSSSSRSQSKRSPYERSPLVLDKSSSNETKKDGSHVSEKSKVRQFKDLMSDHIYSSEMSWERAAEMMKNDSRFTLLSSREMKKLFQEFKDKKLQDEKLNKTEYEERKRKKFEEFLLKDSRMSSTLRYDEADELFETDEIWTSVDDASRQKIFTKLKPIIFNREVKRLKVQRDENKSKLQKLFRTFVSDGKIDFQTTWAQAQEHLLDDKTFLEDEDFQNMDKEDALTIFQNTIKKLEEKHEEEKKFIAKATEFYHAENRRNFLSLLRKLRSERIIHEDSLWKDVFPHIENHQAFLLMLGAPGSSPLVMFKIFVHDLKYNYTHDISVIQSIMKSYHFEITLKTSYDSFMNLIRSTRDGSKVRNTNLAHFYHSQISRLKTTKRSSAPMTPYEKKRTNFKKLLYKLGPEVITKECIYSSLISRILDSPEYKDFIDESEKYVIFKKMKRHFHGSSKQEGNAKNNNNNSSEGDSSESDFEFDKKNNQPQEMSWA